MKMRALAVLIASAPLALLASGCVIFNSAPSLSDVAHERVFRTQGRILVGERLKPASSVEVRLIDVRPGGLSLMGPKDAYKFEDTITKTNAEGRFAIKANLTPRLQRALKKGLLAVEVRGHSEGPGWRVLRMEANPDYVFRKINFPSERFVNGQQSRE